MNSFVFWATPNAQIYVQQKTCNFPNQITLHLHIHIVAQQALGVGSRIPILIILPNLSTAVPISLSTIDEQVISRMVFDTFRYRFRVWHAEVFFFCARWNRIFESSKCLHTCAVCRSVFFFFFLLDKLNFCWLLAVRSSYKQSLD